DVRSGRGSELHRPLAEALGQKPPEKPAVVRQGGRCESPLGGQIALVLALQQAEGRRVDHGSGWARSAAAAQVGEKASDRCDLAAVHAGPARTTGEKPVKDALAQVGDAESATRHPPVEASEHADLQAHGRGGVPEASEALNEGVQV